MEKLENYLNTNALVSIIVPTYNRATELKRCISSLINQTYKNIEIIVVDFNSKDSTEDVLKSFDDERIVYVNSIHKGAIAQRSYGVSIAKGKYIQFVDSDDEVSRDFVMFLLFTIEKFGCDIASCWITSEYDARNDLSSFNYNLLVGKNYEKLLKNIRNTYASVSCCNKIVKSAICKEICDKYYNYNTTKITSWEDTIYYYSLFFNSKSVCFTDASLYRYIKNGAHSNSSEKPSMEKVKKTTHLINYLEDIVNKSIFPNYNKQLYIYFFFEITNYLVNEPIKKYTSFKKMYRNIVIPLFKNYLKKIYVFQKEFSNLEKCLAFSFKHNLVFSIYILILKAKKKGQLK